MNKAVLQSNTTVKVAVVFDWDRTISQSIHNNRVNDYALFAMYDDKVRIFEPQSNLEDHEKMHIKAGVLARRAKDIMEELDGE